MNIAATLGLLLVGGGLGWDWQFLTHVHSKAYHLPWLDGTLAEATDAVMQVKWCVFPTLHMMKLFLGGFGKRFWVVSNINAKSWCDASSFPLKNRFFFLQMPWSRSFLASEFIILETKYECFYLDPSPLIHWTHWISFSVGWAASPSTGKLKASPVPTVPRRQSIGVRFFFQQTADRIFISKLVWIVYT